MTLIKPVLFAAMLSVVFLFSANDVSAQTGNPSWDQQDFIGYVRDPELTIDDILDELLGPPVPEEPWGLPEDWTLEEFLDWFFGDGGPNG